jgi:hypothetical protein
VTEKKVVRARLLLIALLGAAASCAPPPPPAPGLLLLSNPDFPTNDVETVITSNADCGARGPGYRSTGEFVLPNNATRFLAVPPGTRICWRHDRVPEQPVAGEWSDWNRAYVPPATTIAANL